MAKSSFIARRSAKRKSEPTQQLLVFQLQQERFALPIKLVYRVVALNELCGAISEAGMGLTVYQNRELPVIDLKKRIYHGIKSPGLPFHHPVTQHSQQTLLLIPNLQSDLVGLMIDGHPSLLRVPESAFSPLQPMYLADGGMRCVCALVVTPLQKTPIFLVDVPQLFVTPSSFPANLQQS